MFYYWRYFVLIANTLYICFNMCLAFSFLKYSDLSLSLSSLKKKKVMYRIHEHPALFYVRKLKTKKGLFALLFKSMFRKI